MKLWQKIYLVTISLFVILLNSGMYLVFDMTYQKNLAAEQKNAASEYRMISANILQSLRGLAGQGRLKKEPLRSLLQIYENYYANEQVHLTLWKDGQCVYPKGDSSLPDRNLSNLTNLSKEEIRVTILSRDGERIAQVQSIVYENNGLYHLQYEKTLSELNAAWQQLEKSYLLVSLGFSLGLAVLLFLLLRRIMKPVRELTWMADEMRSGNLSARVLVKGADDIAVLGEHFNEMAQKIQSDILQIQKEAQAKQDFVDNFAHELKSPITSIYGFAEYIQKAKVSQQEIIECMGFIMDESSRLLHLSYMLLDMAQMRKKEIVMCDTAVQKLFDGIREPLKQIGEERGVNLEFSGGSQYVRGNEILLQSLLYNLIHNGIYACKEGGKVTASAECIQGHVCITVKDNGCGIPQNEIEKLTEPFYRTDKSRNRAEGRTGLGLSLCRQIADLHGAEIHFLSEENKGTKVFVRFP